MSSKIIVGVLVGLVIGGIAGVVAGMGMAEKERAESADAALLTGHQAFQNGNYDAALESAFAATDRRPGAYAGYEIVGDFFAKSYDGAHARVFYQRALEALAATAGASNSVITASTPAQVAFERNRIEGKIKTVEQSAESSTNNH
jgi:Tfp pilus assembly protein PilF